MMFNSTRRLFGTDSEQQGQGRTADIACGIGVGLRGSCSNRGTFIAGNLVSFNRKSGGWDGGESTARPRTGAGQDATGKTFSKPQRSFVKYNKTKFTSFAANLPCRASKNLSGRICRDVQCRLRVRRLLQISRREIPNQPRLPGAGGLSIRLQGDGHPSARGWLCNGK